MRSESSGASIRSFHVFHEIKHTFCTSTAVKSLVLNPIDQLSFRLELAHLQLQIWNSALKQPRSKEDEGLSLFKRDRCHQCEKKRKTKMYVLALDVLCVYS